MSVAAPPICLADVERRAADRLDPHVWDYIQGGSEDEVTLRANRRAFARLTLRPRALARVDGCDVRTTALGQEIALPILIAPIGLQRLIHGEGELATARASAAAGTIFVVSSMSSVAVEELAAVGGALWFQLYVFKDRELTVQLVRRAEAAGCRALVVTVDARRLGRRERDLRNGFALPVHVRPAHVPLAGLDERASNRSALETHAREQFDHSVSWKTIAWLRSLSGLPIVLKGILTREDAERAATSGVQGLIVSNHGGRQLDGVPATIDALAEVVSGAGACEVFLDGGIRRGSDVLKAGALGARAILIGRPALWGLAMDGAAGVGAVLERLRSELETSLTLAGYGRWRAIGPALVAASRIEPAPADAGVILSAVATTTAGGDRGADGDPAANGALALAGAALRDALSSAGRTAQEVDYLVCAASAADLAPSVRLARLVALRADAQRIDLARAPRCAGFDVLQPAVDFCARHPGRLAVVVCAEPGAASAAVVSTPARLRPLTGVELIGAESCDLAEPDASSDDADTVGPADVRLVAALEETIDRALARCALDRHEIAHWRVLGEGARLGDALRARLGHDGVDDGGGAVSFFACCQRLLETKARAGEYVVTIAIDAPAVIEVVVGRLVASDPFPRALASDDDRTPAAPDPPIAMVCGAAASRTGGAEAATTKSDGLLLNPGLANLDAMNFLNEITLRFPHAISFAPGRPFEPLFQTEASLAAIRSFVAQRSAGVWPGALDAVAQYGRTKGIICDLVAEMLRRDEGIDVADEAIVMTVGSQEATFVALSTLFSTRRPEELLLVVDPSYVGVSGAARVLGIDLWAVRGASGLDLGDVERLCRNAQRHGRRVRALYTIPDFSNPQGMTMPLADRRQLLDLAERYDFLVLEDNAYGLFSFGGERLPTLKALDRAQRVVYLGTFSKLIYPGVRVGFAVADQRIAGGLLADAMAKVKSMTTVNTSPLAQAIVGGLLLDAGGTLATVTRAKVEHYRRNHDQLLAALHASLLNVEGVHWNEPQGGFFLTLDVPWPADNELLLESATEDGVLWVPMRYFYLGRGGEQQMRLSFSGIAPADIAVGVERLSGLVRRKIRTARAADGVSRRL